MQLTIYQVDAFADHCFEGNPAAVVPLEHWLPDDLMQAIAAENNLSETAFFVAAGEDFHIRWFTPLNEVELCGHATLASAYVLFHAIGVESDRLSFRSLSGFLSVFRQDEMLYLDFPAQVPQHCNTPASLVAGLGAIPEQCFVYADYIAVFASEEDVAAIQPDYSVLKQLDYRGVIITAPASQQDFVVRFFAPKYGVDEDPVTGSAYTQLTPYWSARLGKTVLRARQISRRGGNVMLEYRTDRVWIGGKAVMYLQGTIDI